MTRRTHSTSKGHGGQRLGRLKYLSGHTQSPAWHLRRRDRQPAETNRRLVLDRAARQGRSNTYSLSRTELLGSLVQRTYGTSQQLLNRLGASLRLCDKTLRERIALDDRPVRRLFGTSPRLPNHP